MGPYLCRFPRRRAAAPALQTVRCDACGEQVRVSAADAERMAYCPLCAAPLPAAEDTITAAAISEIAETALPARPEVSAQMEQAFADTQNADDAMITADNAIEMLLTEAQQMEMPAVQKSAAPEPQAESDELNALLREQTQQYALRRTILEQKRDELKRDHERMELELRGLGILQVSRRRQLEAQLRDLDFELAAVEAQLTLLLRQETHSRNEQNG